MHDDFLIIECIFNSTFGFVTTCHWQHKYTHKHTTNFHTREKKYSQHSNQLIHIENSISAIVLLSFLNKLYSTISASYLIWKLQYKLENDMAKSRCNRYLIFASNSTQHFTKSNKVRSIARRGLYSIQFGMGKKITKTWHRADEISWNCHDETVQYPTA